MSRKSYTALGAGLLAASLFMLVYVLRPPLVVAVEHGTVADRVAAAMTVAFFAGAIAFLGRALISRS